jgi:hypothetical protein
VAGEVLAMNNDDKVGFGRPPKHGRFKPGLSGNPRGRPKRRPTFVDDFKAELREKLSVRENGRERKISKQRALIKALMALALKGNVRAMTAVIASARNFDPEKDDQPQPTLDPIDLDLLENFIARERRREPIERSGSKSSHQKGGRTGKSRDALS